MNETVILFSYPRSGNTWVRYIIEMLTGRPSLGTPDKLESDTPICKRLVLPVNPAAVPSALKRHRLEELSETDLIRPLIVIVRNYKECIVRHNLEHEAINYRFAESRQRYLAPVMYFDRHQHEKLLIHYEDLIEQPSQCITLLARFLAISDEIRDSFLDKRREHCARSLSVYPARSYTSGEKALSHSHRLSNAERRTWDESIRVLNPAIYDKYLSRYKETDYEECHKAG